MRYFSSSQSHSTDLMICRLYKSPFTSADIKASVEDLRVLGKKDFKILLKYRIAIREDVCPPIQFDGVVLTTAI